MKTKYLANILGGLVLLGAMTSCEDYLDMPNFTETDEESVFADDRLAEAFVRGCYRDLIHKEQWYQFLAGDGTVYSCEDGGLTGSKYNIANYGYAPDMTLSTSYTQSNKVIESCNLAIYRLGQRAQSDDVKRLIGEAKVIRALAYLTLIRMYGDVPASWEPMVVKDPTDADVLFPKRVSRDIIYDHIVEDLQEAARDIPWKSELGYNTAERLTKNAALAVLGRVACYAAGYSLRWDLATNDPATMSMRRRDDAARVNELYQIASDACKELMTKGENGLIKGTSGFHDLFYSFCQRDFGKSDYEMLFTIAEYGEITNADFPKYLNVGSEGGVYGRYRALQTMSPVYYLSFDPKDTRRDVTCANFGCFYGNVNDKEGTQTNIGVTYTMVPGGKFRIPWCTAYEVSSTSKRNVNLPVIRYAEVLLNYAEAEAYLHNGPTADAISALKEVRSRAGVDHLPIASDLEGFIDDLAQERMWELSGEMLLKTDLIRINRLAKVLAADKQGSIDMVNRAGKYANLPQYRLYKYTKDENKWGYDILALDYIDLDPVADAAEIAQIKSAPTASGYDAYLEKTAAIARAHGKNVGSGDKWYPIDMYLGFQSDYNKKSMAMVGYTSNDLCIGNAMKTATINKGRGGSMPAWVTGLYSGFVENRSELLPFANLNASDPMVTNPNLTQLPGYATGAQ
ncbi:MAG: RagB/SusD family nutrient uptake outer membrane protein [Bacteroides sp.]|nr:RagB/SusD family nutrient uptake outer membrane protein [Bacteroides sp.]MCM1389924.1 RagB/SusD family nutrient uptake outer membrane protein [Bacteroides sp.]